MSQGQAADQAPTYQALRQAPRLALADRVPLAAPLTVYLEPTNVCNFKCRYCPVHLDDYAVRSGGLGRLSLEDCARVYDEILTLGRLRTLNLYMLGEPFANRDLTAFIALAKRRNVADRVIVTTNATLLDEATALRTIESGLDYLRVSVYGATAERMRALTGSRIPLERVAANLARLKALRDARGARAPFIYVKMIDAGDEAENRRFLETFGPLADEAAIEPAMNWNMAQDEIDFTGGRPQGAARGRSACPFPFYTLVVNSDLRVTVCCVDWEKATAIGDLRGQSLREIWGGQALRAFQLAHLGGRRSALLGCRSCTYLDTAPDELDALSPETFAARAAAGTPLSSR